MEVHTIYTETLKPSTPTPTHLKCYNLLSMDQLNPRDYMRVVLFYSNYGGNSTEKSRQLKSSLSKTLSQYYPFAGRLTDGPYIDCNDEGIEFHEAKLECKLGEILRKPEDEDVSILFPPGLVLGSLNNHSSLVVIQLNHFICGGLAMTVCMSHKVADACTAGNFLFHWAAVAHQSGEQVSPVFVSSPSKESITLPEYPQEKKNWVTRKFVFHNSKIAYLKATVAKSGVQDPTRVSVVIALLYKCAMAATKANSGSFEPSALTHLVNMRPKMVPPLPKTSVGNLYWKIVVETKNESETELSVLVDQIKKGEMQIKGLKSLDGNEYWKVSKEMESKKYKEYLSSSLCGFPFYEMDFGWGKPIRVRTGGTTINNMFVLMDTPSGDGIEALVSLPKQDMAAFQVYKEIHVFSSSL